MLNIRVLLLDAKVKGSLRTINDGKARTALSFGEIPHTPFLRSGALCLCTLCGCVSKANQFPYLQADPNVNMYSSLG